MNSSKVIEIDKEVRHNMIMKNRPLALSVAKGFFGKTNMPSEDIKQEAICGLMHAIDRYDGRGQFSTYAYPCIRGFITRALKRKSNATMRDAVPIGEDDLASEDLQRSELDVRDSVEFFMSHVTSRERDLMKRMFGMGENEREGLKEIAASEKVSKQMVSQREIAVLDKMRRLLVCKPRKPVFMVTDPDRCTDYNRSEAQMQEFLLFCVAVAGKTARVVRRCLDDFWIDAMNKVDGWGDSPFLILRRLSKRVSMFLKKNGIGCHKLKGRAFRSLAESDIDLKNCSIEDLEDHVGIGMKTSRFFILHSRPGARVACLDTHILKFLRSMGVVDAPYSTPVGEDYLALEEKFLSMVPAGKSVAEFDLAVWQRYARGDRDED